MQVTDVLHRWTVPFVLAIASLVLWQLASSSDIPKVSSTPIAYEASVETPVLSARRVSQTIQGDLADNILVDELQSLVSRAPSTSCLAVRRGTEPIGLESNVDLPLIPASNQKIVTTFAALNLLGDDFRFTTTVRSETAQEDGKVEGNLYLVGGGDPFLTTQDWWSQYDEPINTRANTSLEELADSVVASGITEISGGIIGDESLLDSQRTGPWAERLVEQNQSGPLSALVVNEGFTVWPEDFALNFGQRVKSENPPLDAAALFRGLLEARGVVVTGDSGTGTTPVEAPFVAEINSPSLNELVTHINSYSSNIGAELLIKALGLADSGTGSTEAGAEAVVRVLESSNFSLDGIVVKDGSGLSEQDRLTCSLLMEILSLDGVGNDLGQISGGLESKLAQSLSISGQRGSLAERFLNSSADGNVFAKTGTLQSVTALSGFVDSSMEEDLDLVFTFIANQPSITGETLGLQSELVMGLSQYPQTPRLSELLPKSAISE